MLGRAATWRLSGVNAGAALVTAGQLAGSEPVTLAGVAIVVTAGLATLALLGASLRR